ncbi:MAG TPA: acyl-CoA dehydrogenase family protein [Jatrophihabitans sp.]
MSAEESEIVRIVGEFVDRDVRPAVRELERHDTYPEKLIEQMKQLGIFGLAIPEPYGESHVSTPCYSLVTEELARGWMSLAGAMGGHSVIAKLLVEFGTDEQKAQFLPRMATGELRATMALTEAQGGSDLQAIKTTASPDLNGDFVVNGSKIWISNAQRSQLIATLVRTDPDAVPAHHGMSILLAERGPGLTVSEGFPKLGYKGVEACEVSFDEYRAPRTAILGLTQGRGFAQMMYGLALGRVQVAARAVGVARAAFEDAREYAAERVTFGVPIWQHQSIGNYLAEMATKLTASRLLVLDAAEVLDSGARCDLEAGMAKLFASESCMQIVLDAMRIFGASGYSTDLDIERYFRDAPLMIVGEGTNEIQRNLICRQVMARGSSWAG